MTVFRRIVFLVILFLVPLTGMAQETMVLTLEESVGLALKQNPEILMADKELAKSKAGVWEAYAAVMPSVDATANLSHAWSIQESTIPNFIKRMLGEDFPGYEDMPDFVPIAFGLENTFTYGVMLNQPLFLGGAGIAGIQMANAMRRATEHRYESTKQGLIYNTVAAFYSCLLARDVVDVQEEALDQAEENLDVVHKKYEAGSASGFDKMRAEVEVANLRPAVIASENEFRAALTGLRMVLGLPKETAIQVKGLLAFAPDELGTVALEEMQDRALQNRPEVLEMEATKTMTRKGMALARSEFLPKVLFSTDYSFLAMRNDLKFTDDDFSKGFTSAVSVQVPLFRGIANHKRYRKARLDYKIVLDSEKMTRDGIAAEVEIAFNTFKETTQRYEAARESVELAEEALRLANLMYEEGASTQLDVLNSQLALTQARLNLASALFEYQMSRYEVRRVTGTLEGIL